MRVDALALRLRARSNVEAADLGVRLCQHSAAAVYRCYLAVALPLLVVCLAAFEIAAWIPTLAIWWAKPWLDRTILFVLSRAAFGESTRPIDVWNAQRTVWWGQFLRTWTVLRISPWRALTLPVHLLEGLPGNRLRQRAQQIRAGKMGAGALLTSIFAFVELALLGAALSLIFWLAPKGMAPDVTLFFEADGAALAEFAIALAYAAVVAFLEPYYVAAGFGMYLNRRVELEAWDIEQEFRRAFAH